MSALREWLARVTGFLTRRNEQDLRDELSFHVEMLEAELRRAGVSADEARRQARARLGGATQIAEAWRDQRGLPFLDALTQDLRYGLRTLVRTPGFTIAALVTLALGIGANTAIFSLVNAVLLRPLPYPDGGRVVALGEADRAGRPGTLGYLTFSDYRDRAATFESMAAVRSWNPTLVVNGEAERLPAMRVSWTFFDVLGVHPALGTAFGPAEDRPEQWRVVVLSDRLWRRRFGADPSIVGRTMSMNDQTYRIAGVMPASFEPLVSTVMYQPADVWAPLGYDATLPYACRTCQHLKAVGRLRTGVTIEQARADLAGIRSQLAATYPTEYDNSSVAVASLQEMLSGPVRRLLLVLLAAVAFVLLIACANVANLLLARGTTRTREMAVRSALGAGRRRLVRQLLTESLMLSLAGALAGVGVAAAVLAVVSEIAPVTIPRLAHATIDGPVLSFALVLAVVTGLLFGVLPALRSARHAPSLAIDSRTSVGGAGRARRVLVIADLALALVLLSGAALMLRSVERLMLVDPGFRADGVLTMNFSLVGSAYAEDAAVVNVIDRVVQQVRALPGVQAAAIAGQIPLGGNGDRWGFHVEGRVPLNPEEDPAVERVFGDARLLPGDGYSAEARPAHHGGRPCRESSGPSSSRRAPHGGYGPGRTRSASAFASGSASDGPWRTVVGVAGDVRHADLAAAPTLQMYMAQAQSTDSFLVLTVRSADGNPAALAPAIREVLHRVDPAVPVYAVATMEELVSKTVADRRFVLELLGAFALMSLLLAAVGLYGVVAYLVTQRTRELGVRVALGATPADIVRLVLGSGVATVLAGLGRRHSGRVVHEPFSGHAAVRRQCRRSRRARHGHGSPRRRRHRGPPAPRAARAADQPGRGAAPGVKRCACCGPASPRCSAVVVATPNWTMKSSFISRCWRRSTGGAA